MERDDHADWQVCDLCGRAVPPWLITLHHLVPRQKGGKAEHRRPFCRPCHKQLHATFSNADLARRYATLEQLRSAEALQPFLVWIRRQRPERNFRTAVAGSHPTRGRRRR